MIVEDKKTATRCDGCGRISNHPLGEYRVSDSQVGYINSHGRNCEHDFCETCESVKNPTGRCCKCGEK